MIDRRQVGIIPAPCAPVGQHVEVLQDIVAAPAVDKTGVAAVHVVVAVVAKESDGSPGAFMNLQVFNVGEVG